MSLRTSRWLALCADDYGAGSAIDHGIAQLAAAGRLSEVSCLVNAPAWARDACALAEVAGTSRGALRLGLHINLTEGEPLSPALRRHWPRLPGLGGLILRAHAGALPMSALRDELQAQFDAFGHHADREPDHVDGHQHVHHLPGVRSLLMEAVVRRPGMRVRDTGTLRGPGYAFKRWVICHTGGAALSLALQREGRAANACLLGVYDFRTTDYRRLMQGWLVALPKRGALLFCHPADDGGLEPGDAIAMARQREYHYLASSDFDDDLAAADVRLAPQPWSAAPAAISGQSSSAGSAGS